jgi:hypothetical protein
MLKVSLSMKPAGSIKALRKAFSVFLGARGRLIIKKGLYPPIAGPAVEQRDAVISLFMSTADDKASVAGQDRFRTLLSARMLQLRRHGG